MYVGGNLRLPLYDHGKRMSGGHEGPTRAFVRDACLAYSSEQFHLHIHVPIFTSKLSLMISHF